MKPPERSLVYGICLALVAAIGLNTVYSNMVTAQTEERGSSDTNPLFVRDVDNFAREIDTVQLSSNELNSFIVPEGRFLVVEHVSGACQVPRKEGLLNALVCSTDRINQARICFNLAPVLIGSDATTNTYAFSHPMRIRSKGRINFDGTSSLTYAATCRGQISGYLVDQLPKG